VALVIAKIGLTPPPPGREVEFTGIVESIPTPPPLGHWKIGGRDVLVNGLTRITGNPAVGDRVEVKGILQAPSGGLMPTNASFQIVATNIEKKESD